MRITHEADYAVRIVYTLLKEGKLISSRDISEKSGVTLRFTLKILRKLSTDGIVCAQKGVSGGYMLAASPDELSLGQIIESIDGPFEISHCLSDDFDCTRISNKNICQFRQIFSGISQRLKDELYAIKMTTFN